jgi:hypothetical protein
MILEVEINTVTNTKDVYTSLQILTNQITQLDVLNCNERRYSKLNHDLNYVYIDIILSFTL